VNKRRKEEKFLLQPREALAPCFDPKHAGEKKHVNRNIRGCPDIAFCGFHHAPFIWIGAWFPNQNGNKGDQLATI
jgi:hypothetical protein